MRRMNNLTLNTLCKVVERFRFHSRKAREGNPIVSDIAKKMCEVELWEMWVLTQR